MQAVAQLTFADVLTKASPIVITASKTAPSTCDGNNGTITINNSGGTAPFVYNLDNINYTSNNIFSNLAAATYTAFVKDEDGCTVSVPVALDNASALVITSLGKTDPTGCSIADGTIAIHHSGGTAPFQFSLDNVTYSSSPNFDHLAAGSFTAFVKDANGCTTSSAVALTNPSSPAITSLTTIPPSSCITNDGALTIHSSGGTSPFQYSLNNVSYSSIPDFANLAAGTYTGYVKDANGCIASLTDLINNYSSSLEVFDLTKSAASACNDDGSITINPDGGYSPYEFSLNNVDYTANNVFGPLAGGTYTAYIRDAKGCIVSYTDVVNKASPLVVSVSEVPASRCSNDGIITITGSGGKEPYTYSLDNNNFLFSNVFNNIEAGAYTAYIKDEEGCTVSVSSVLTSVSLDVTISSTSPSACSDDGTITIHSSSGASPFTYSLDDINYSSNNVFSNLAAGTYTAYVKDANGCASSISTELSKLTPVTIDLAITSASSCNNDGKIIINGSGGASPYQYSLDDVNYFSSPDFINLAAGTYTAYVKDANGCTSSLSTELTKLTPVTINIAITPASSCNDDGKITINGSGGASPYQYSLDDVNYFSSPDFLNLMAETYTAYVKDANGCTSSLSTELTKLTLVTIDVEITPASSCNNDGKITINGSGGASPYQYSLDDVNYFSSPDFSNLAAGTYTAYVKDANGCTSSLSTELTKLTPVTINIAITPASSCNDDGKITINGSGGASPFQYSLDDVNYFSSPDFINLAAGTYTAYVKDANGCTSSLSTELTSTALLITNLTKSSPSCSNDGKITINKTGGSSPHTYSIDNINYFSSPNFSNLSPGTYTVYVKDSKGCIASFTDELTGSSPVVITDLITTPASACADDGEITINASSGTPTYTYSLNNVDYFSSPIFTNLGSGNYTCYVKDATGCTASLSDVLTRATSSLAITSLTKIAASACINDGKITINKTGGNSPYSYSLDGINYISDNVFGNLAAGNYTAYVKDVEGCTASLGDVLLRESSSLRIANLYKTSPSSCNNNGSIKIDKSGGYSPFLYSLNNLEYVSGNVFGNLAAGTYTGYVKDSKGCIASASITLTAPSPLIVTSLTTTSASACVSDGKITINKTGGSSPYLYSLDNVNYVAGNMFSNLAAGTYTGYVKDAKGCIASFTNELTGAASTLKIAGLSIKSPSSCSNNGSITIIKSGGSSPYLYSLDDVNYFSGNVFNNLAGGTYTAYVKDGKGCIASVNTTLTPSSPLVITSLTKTAATACTNNGKITINKTGGSSPYLYSLDGVNYVSGNVFSNLAAATYTAYVKDSKGCIASLTDVLTGAASNLQVTGLGSKSPSACSDNGSMTISKSGGTSPYLYSLDNVNYFSSNVFSNLGGGTFTGYVKDAKGCIASSSGTLVKPSALSITSVSKVNPSTCSVNGKITINRTGGSSPYLYSLDNVNYSSSNIFSNLAEGTYKAFVKDAKACIASIENIVLSGPACQIARSTFEKSSTVSKKSMRLSIQAYPNPSAEQFSLMTEGGDNNQIYITVTDVLGKKRLFTRIAPKSVFKFGKDLRTGTYIVEALQGIERATLTIIKTRY